MFHFVWVLPQFQAILEVEEEDNNIGNDYVLIIKKTKQKKKQGTAGFTTRSKPAKAKAFTYKSNPPVFIKVASLWMRVVVAK